MVIIRLIPFYISLLVAVISPHNDDLHTPIVLLHGITSDKSELLPVEMWLRKSLPNPVYNIEIGNGRRSSIARTMSTQTDELCTAIYDIPELQRGFHFIGMSQGGLLARSYVQRCNRFPVRNLITWVSPQAGVYGFNEIYFNWDKVYKPLYQSLYSFAGYWKDPYRYRTYISNSTFLPYLNNESPDLDRYAAMGFDFHRNRDQIESLENFVMVWSPNDDVLSPPQSGKFEFYETCDTCPKGEVLTIKPFFDSSQFVDNLLGLRTLYNSGRLHTLETNCTHSGHKTVDCFEQLEYITFPFLK
jgi:palmitoyl-protein thioesterase